MGYNDAGHETVKGEKARGKESRNMKAIFLSSCLPILLLAIVPLSGCKSDPGNGAMADSYYLDPGKDLRALGRVALLELNNLSGYPQIALEVTNALYPAVQKEQRFGLTVVQQDNPAWRDLQESMDSLQAMRQLSTVREMLQCNGLLLGTVTQYQPYPHMVLALRLKLIDLTDGQLIWALEQVWDSGDKSVQKRIEKYSKQQLRSEHTPLGRELVVVSSLNFCRFVAYEVAATLRQEQE